MAGRQPDSGGEGEGREFKLRKGSACTAHGLLAQRQRSNGNKICRSRSVSPTANTLRTVFNGSPVQSALQ
ncbi:UNVERIFIED_CONTAM: hypothetical protein K2H54_010292 [Gekko kuhli]